jgi:Major Facilitator Superfamily
LRDPQDPRRWWILVLVAVAQLIVVLDVTIVKNGGGGQGANRRAGDGDGGHRPVRNRLRVQQRGTPQLERDGDHRFPRRGRRRDRHFRHLLFLTFYLQQTLGYSPVKTGVAFLPQVAAVMVTATTSSALLLPRIGPRPLMATGLVVAAAGMVLLTQVGVHSSYAGHILPGLLVTGLGLGLAISVALNTGTLGVTPADAGVASATVNTMQQIGGSLGTALLSTVSASAASGTSRASSRPPPSRPKPRSTDTQSRSGGRPRSSRSGPCSAATAAQRPTSARRRNQPASGVTSRARPRSGGS